MLGLYIHIPFCIKKCYYCDFASYEKSEHLMTSYVEALLKNLDIYADKKFDTIFIGGGTPSYLDEGNLEKLLLGINRKIDISRIKEFTIECNPGTLTLDKFKIIKMYGVNRLSIGLQSVNDDTLQFMGRSHNFKDFDDNFNYAYKLGFRNINVDLIFGMSYENLDRYKNTLDVISQYNLSHISAYNLILEENTKFYKMNLEGKFVELEEELQLEMYNYTKYFLEDIGYSQYEISNFVKGSNECLHNLIYWNFEDYIGIGVGAHSFYKGNRFENTKNINNYIDMFNNNKYKPINYHKNSNIENIEEYIMLGFRKIKGIDLGDFERRFNKDIFVLFKYEIEKHIENELLYYGNNRLFLTIKGMTLMNYVLKDFIFK